MDTETARMIAAAREARAAEFAAASQTRDAWPYTMTDADIAELIDEYGYRLSVNASWSQAYAPKPARRLVNPYPIYRLREDGLWHRITH